MESTTTDMDFATVHNDDTSPHKFKSFSLIAPLRNFDQSIEESQPHKNFNQRCGLGADDGVPIEDKRLHDSKTNQIKKFPSRYRHHHHLKTTTEVVSSRTSTALEEGENPATAFEYPIDYSKKQVSGNKSQLRENLSMKSPVTNEESLLIQGTVLNLSKETTYSSTIQPNQSAIFLQSNSPRPAKIPLNLMAGESVNGSISPLPSLPYGQSFSPLMNQTVPGTSMMVPLPYDNLSPTLFSGHNFSPLGQSKPLQLPSLVPTLQLPLLSQNTQKAKATRPFKAYPKDPLSLPPLGLYGLGSSTMSVGKTTEAGSTTQANQAYTDFRKRMLAASSIGRCKRVTISHGGNLARNNSSPYTLPSPSMSSSASGTDEVGSDDGNLEISENSQVEKCDNQLKDDAYWERRRKNNLAAKRSRDARRAKEDEIAIRAAFLEQENLKLRFEVCALKNETAKLRCMLYR